MGVELVLMSIIIIVVNGIHAIYSYLSNKRAISIIKDHIAESQKNYNTLHKKIEHDNNNVKQVYKALLDFQEEIDDKLKQINQTIDELKKCKQK